MGRVFDIDAWAVATARSREAAGRPWAEGHTGRLFCADCAARVGLELEPGGLVSIPEIECDGCGATFTDDRTERSHTYGQGPHALLDDAMRSAWASGWRGGPHVDVDRLRRPHPDGGRCRWAHA
jgi:hypothetical protein